MEWPSILPSKTVSRILSDMKILSMRDLNRNTASVLDALERGESFEIRRKGRSLGYLTRRPPPSDRKPDWTAHFEWLRKQRTTLDAKLLGQFETTRRRLLAREQALKNSA